MQSRLWIRPYLKTHSRAIFNLTNISNRMNRRVLIIVSLLGISILLFYKGGLFQMEGPKMIKQESGNKINVVLFTPKTTPALPKIELIPEKVEKYNFTKSKKRPLKEKLQPVDIADWTILAEMPTYKQPKRVLQSDWWKAAAFLEIIGNDFSFDDAMAKLGCEVHSFDPSMNMPEHVRNTSVVFHPIGLSTSVIKDFNPRHDIYVIQDQSWTMMDLLSIMEMLGHKNRVLDYLKIDVEGHEWSVIDYLLKNGITSRIRHFSLEYHIFPDWPDKARYPDLLRTYKRLKEAGFYKYFTGIHPLDHTPKKFNIQADVCYVNIKFQS
uniref:Methyltransferase domain-containing protein n=1 Tax=Magallana gigas TaxID=29159 RepID=K1PN51_MAGGI